MLLPLCTALIILVATTISATFGFGSALVAMPLLAPLLGIKTAAPFFNLIGSTSTIILVLLNWRQIILRAAWHLFAGTLVGIPLGIFLTRTLPEPLVVGVLGIILILFGLYRYVDAPLPKLRHPGWGYSLGFIAGILGGAYNT
ncbi:MAG: sulfite exporter TauE/SafE family protein, partial [Symploca sp. SIO2B6]|nr:sulfite exporter TauE/SafE family protein [Symploca sp. SIO2B6]